MVNSVCLSSDGRHALSGSDDRTVKLWDVATGRCLRTFEGHTGRVNCVALSADCRYALSGSSDCTIKVWALDWELEDRDPADWDEGARPYLENFLTLRSAGKNWRGRWKKPVWNDEDFKKLLKDLQYRGCGWLRPEGVRRKLEEMTCNWQGPPPLPGED